MRPRPKLRQAGGPPMTHAMIHDAIDDLSTVYREHVHFAWRIVRRMGVPEESVGDVVQDVFLVIHRRLPDYDGRAPLKAWIAGICRGVVRNFHRSTMRRERRLRLVSPPAQGDPDSSDRLEMGRALAHALDQLDEDQRLAIVLVEIEGLSPADVADLSGVSRNTVYSRLKLARKKLRAQLSALRPDGPAQEEPR